VERRKNRSFFQSGQAGTLVAADILNATTRWVSAHVMGVMDVTGTNLVSTTKHALITTGEDTSIYERFYTYIAVFGGYLIIVFIGLGLFGNVLSIIIFIRQRRRDSVSSIYLGCLAVSDTGNLVSGIGFWGHQSLYYMSYYRVNMPHAWSDLSCKLIIYVWFNCQFISAWIIIAFSIERMIAVLLPLKVSNIATPRRRKIGLVCLLLISLIIWLDVMPIYKMYSPFPPGHEHRVICHLYELELPMWVVVTFCTQIFALVQILPCIIISFLNLIIMIGIMSKDSNLDSTKDSKRSKKEMRCLVNLLSVSTAYVVLMSPFAILWAYYMYEHLTGWLGRTAAYKDFISEAAYYTNSIAMINYGINFIIYTVSLDFYREEVKTMFRCVARNSKDNSHSLS
jgi:hypothetical protein